MVWTKPSDASRVMIRSRVTRWSRALLAALWLSRSMRSMACSIVPSLKGTRSALKRRCSSMSRCPALAWQYTSNATAILNADAACTTWSAFKVTAPTPSRSSTQTAPVRDAVVNRSASSIASVMLRPLHSAWTISAGRSMRRDSYVRRLGTAARARYTAVGGLAREVLPPHTLSTESRESTQARPTTTA